ncbi:MAG: CHAD domain-containing protein [Solirubrobacteraceae bacterium]
MFSTVSVPDLIAPDRFTPDLLDDALAGEFTLGEVEAAAGERVYYDTFDGLLRAGGVTLRHSQGALELVPRHPPRNGASGAAPAGAGAAATPPLSLAIAEPATPLLGGGLPAGQLRDAVLELIDVRALLALARVRVLCRTRRVLDDERKTVARISIEEPMALADGGGEIRLRTRVSLLAVRGYGGELEHVSEMLSAGLGLEPAAEPLVDEALRASGRPPAGTSAKIDVELRPEDRTDEAAVRVLQRLLEVMDDTLPGTLADLDTEFLHDYRVAVRRTRSVQRELARAFEPGPLAQMRTEFRWLQQVTSETRDLDVYVLDFEQMRGLLPELLRSDLDPLLGVLRRRRLLARQAMSRDLRSERSERLRVDWTALLGSLVERPVQERPYGARPIGEVSAERIRRVYRQMAKMGDAIDPESPPEDYHELRKKGKELRYLLELFGVPLHDETVVKPMIRSLKGLQDVLGRHQDREVQIGKLRSLASEVSTITGGPGAVLAMGALIERLHEDMLAARGEFAESFATFASREKRRLVRETFA